MENISENARRILDRARAAAERAGTRVTVVAASKMNDTAAVHLAYEGGIRCFGENRVQELETKLREGAYDGAKLHFIGHLQRNKVRALVGRVDLIESVDSAELMDMISARATALGTVQPILIEVNIGGEAAKSGVEPERLEELLEHAGGAPGVSVRGLMTIPPRDPEKEKTVRYFEQMRKLFVDMSGKKYDNVTMTVLSMGMSGDFEEAIACGANTVRVGSAIFGQRR